MTGSWIAAALGLTLGVSYAAAQGDALKVRITTPEDDA